MITDYASLQANIAGWLARTDLTEEIKTFIQLAEFEIDRRLPDALVVERSAQETITAGQQLTLPPHCVAVHSMWLGPNQLPLEYRTVDAGIREFGSTPATPHAYTIVANETGASIFGFFPPVAGEHTLYITYYAKPAPLSDAAPTNAWITNLPDALLFGALVKATGYIQTEAQRTTFWAAQFGDAIQRFKEADWKLKYPTSAIMRPGVKAV